MKKKTKTEKGIGKEIITYKCRNIGCILSGTRFTMFDILEICPYCGMDTLTEVE